MRECLLHAVIEWLYALVEAPYVLVEALHVPVEGESVSAERVFDSIAGLSALIEDVFVAVEALVVVVERMPVSIALMSALGEALSGSIEAISESVEPLSQRPVALFVSVDTTTALGAGRPALAATTLVSVATFYAFVEMLLGGAAALSQAEERVAVEGHGDARDEMIADGEWFPSDWIGTSGFISETRNVRKPTRDGSQRTQGCDDERRPARKRSAQPT